jgi:predicted acyl esterase
LKPNKPEELAVVLFPAANLFAQGHRIRLELANCDSLAQNNHRYRRTLLLAAKNTVVQGGGKSRIILPVIPR